MQVSSDSMVISIPHMIHTYAPSPAVWSTAGTIVSGIVVTTFAFFLARRRFKTERWHERRGEAYGKILKYLHEIARDSRRLADREEQVLGGEPPRFSSADYEAFANTRGKAYDQLGETFEECRYLLSASAIQSLERFVHSVDDMVNSDSTRPELIWMYVSRDVNRDLHEVYQVDVGTELGIVWLLRRAGRATAESWRLLTSRLRSAYRGIDRKLEELMLASGPQLTQNDVRTPPKYRHFKSVQEMKRLGYSRGAIQYELKLQRRADPPPWSGAPSAEP